MRLGNSPPLGSYLRSPPHGPLGSPRWARDSGSRKRAPALQSNTTCRGILPPPFAARGQATHSAEAWACLASPEGSTWRGGRAVEVQGNAQPVPMRPTQSASSAQSAVPPRPFPPRLLASSPPRLSRPQGVPFPVCAICVICGSPPAIPPTPRLFDSLARRLARLRRGVPFPIRVHLRSSADDLPFLPAAFPRLFDFRLSNPGRSPLQTWRGGRG